MLLEDRPLEIIAKGVAIERLRLVGYIPGSSLESFQRA